MPGMKHLLLIVFVLSETSVTSLRKICIFITSNFFRIEACQTCFISFWKQNHCSLYCRHVFFTALLRQDGAQPFLILEFSNSTVCVCGAVPMFSRIQRSVNKGSKVYDCWLNSLLYDTNELLSWWQTGCIGCMSFSAGKAKAFGSLGNMSATRRNTMLG